MLIMRRTRSLQLSIAWIVAAGLNCWSMGVLPGSLHAETRLSLREPQLFPTTDPRGYLTVVTKSGADGNVAEPDAWTAGESKSIHTSRTNTSVTFSTKLPGHPTDWRLGVTGGSQNGPTLGAYPVLVEVNESPVGMVSLDGTGGLDTAWMAIGQLTGKVRVKLTWGEGSGALGSAEPFNLTSVQFARPYRDPDNGPMTGPASGPGAAGGGGGREGIGGGGPIGGGGGGTPESPEPFDFPEPTDPMLDPDLTPPDPHDRRGDPPYEPPPYDPPNPPSNPPGNPSPPSDPPPGPPPPPLMEPPPNIPSPGAVLPISLGGLALLHRRRPLRSERS